MSTEEIKVFKNFVLTILPRIAICFIVYETCVESPVMGRRLKAVKIQLKTFGYFSIYIEEYGRVRDVMHVLGHKTLRTL